MTTTTHKRYLCSIHNIFTITIHGRRWWWWFVRWREEVRETNRGSKSLLNLFSSVRNLDFFPSSWSKPIFCGQPPLGHEISVTHFAFISYVVSYGPIALICPRCVLVFWCVLIFWFVRPGSWMVETLFSDWDRQRKCKPRRRFSNLLQGQGRVGLVDALSWRLKGF